MSRDWDKKPNIDLMQFYTDIPKEAKLNLYHEYQDKSCHFIYDGPVWITAGIRHNAGDAPADWSALIVPGTETMNARSGELTQYVKNMAPGCPQSTDDWATTGILGSVTCFEMDYKPMTFGEGSTISFTSDDPKVKLTPQLFSIRMDDLPIFLWLGDVPEYPDTKKRIKRALFPLLHALGDIRPGL